MALGCGFFTKDSDGELGVVKTSATISVIGIEEGTKLFFREVHAAFF